MKKISLFLVALLFTGFANATDAPKVSDDRNNCPDGTTWGDLVKHCVNLKDIVKFKCPDGTMWSEALPFQVPPPKSMPNRDPHLPRCVQVKQVAPFEIVDESGKNYGYGFSFVQADYIKNNLAVIYQKDKVTFSVINNRTHTLYPD